MKNILRNALALLAGLLAGGLLNMALVMVSGMVIAPPPGSDLTTVEGLERAMPLMQPKHFLMPYLAHALGTLLGAFVAARIATADRKFVLALGVGVVFLVGGIVAVSQIPAPMWFNVTDLLTAYLPMAWIGYKLATR